MMDLMEAHIRICDIISIGGMIRSDGKMSKSPIPFGMLFVEENIDTDSEALSQPQYDPNEGLSYVVDESGNLIPFVTWGWTALSATKTGVTTKNLADKSDVDAWPNGVVALHGTKTATKATESSDND